MERSTEADFERVKWQLDRISWPLAILGIWPKNLTTSSRVKSTIFMTSIGIHLLVLLFDLTSVMGNVELVVLNVLELGFTSIVMFRIIVIRFNKKIRRIIDALQGDLVIDYCRDSGDLEFFLEYTSIVDKLYRMGTSLGIVGGVMYYLTPLHAYIKARMMNETAVLGTPFRFYPFVDITPIQRTAIVYILQSPLAYSGVCYGTSCGILLAFVTSMCAYLAILTHKISTMEHDNGNPRIFFRRHTQRHLKIQGIIKSLNEVFCLVLLYELLVTAVVIGLLAYQILLSVGEADMFSTVRFLSCVFSMIVCVYINCFMGECLNAECSGLLNAYYECKWYEMSSYHKNALILCMNIAQKPMRLTAGKFYAFSLESFAKIMKSSIVYVSMLRTLI